MINVEKSGVSEVELKEAIKASEDIISYGNYRAGFTSFSQGFFTNTECIKEPLEKENFAKTRALSVLASGDHVFNLVHAGVKIIDAFDINLLQYFVYHLRVAFLKNYAYEDYIKICSAFLTKICAEDLIEIINKLKASLPIDVYEYYRGVLDFNLTTRRIKNLYFPVSESFYLGNNYLASEKDYLALKKELEETEVNIYIGNAIDVPQELDTKYSIVLLSNIADYLVYMLRKFGLKEFRDFIASFKGMLLDDGLIINYLYSVYGVSDAIIETTNGEEKISPRALGLDNVVKIETYPYGLNAQGYYRVRKK